MESIQSLQWQIRVTITCRLKEVALNLKITMDINLYTALAKRGCVGKVAVSSYDGYLSHHPHTPSKFSNYLKVHHSHKLESDRKGDSPCTFLVLSSVNLEAAQL